MTIDSTMPSDTMRRPKPGSGSARQPAASARLVMPPASPSVIPTATNISSIAGGRLARAKRCSATIASRPTASTKQPWAAAIWYASAQAPKPSVSVVAAAISNEVARPACRNPGRAVSRKPSTNDNSKPWIMSARWSGPG